MTVFVTWGGGARRASLFPFFAACENEHSYGVCNSGGGFVPSRNGEKHIAASG